MLTQNKDILLLFCCLIIFFSDRINSFFPTAVGHINKATDMDS